MGNPYLLLWLEAPLQSWGHNSRYDYRDSLDFPSKSGVFGLLCCALGAGGEQGELLGRLADLDMQVVAYLPAGSQCDGKFKIGSPVLQDFQTVGAGYKRGSASKRDKIFDPWEALLIPLSADQKNQKVAVGYRAYLQDVAFAVALEVPSEEAQTFANALQNPRWDLYLGRKCCAPTEFIYRGVYPNAETAMVVAASLAEAKGRAMDFTVQQGKHEGDVIVVNDVPLQFGPHKRYRSRYVTVKRVSDFQRFLSIPD